MSRLNSTDCHYEMSATFEDAQIGPGRDKIHLAVSMLCQFFGC